MESDEVTKTEHRARLAYEASRLRRAVVAFAPILLLVVAAALIGHRVEYAMVFGSALFAVGVVLLWYGHDIRRAVIPGVLAGLVPLVFALCAKRMGHACTGDGCMTLCVPACAAGGFLAGIVINVAWFRHGRYFGFWLAASAVTLLTGAMGCACTGVLGLVGLTLGYAATAVGGLLLAVLRRRSAVR
jgi:hypothetical protein